MLKKAIGNIALVVGFLLLFGIMIGGSDFRNGIANVVDSIFAPLAVLMPFHAVIFVMASITGLYAALIQKYTIDWKLLREAQKRLKDFHTEYREAMKANNKYKLKKLEEERQEIMQLQGEMSKQQFKPMAYIAILSVPLFMWIYMELSGNNFTVIAPFSGEVGLTQKVIGPIQWWFVWYFLSSMPVSQMIRKILDIGAT